MTKKWLKFSIELQIILFIAIFGNLVKQKFARNGKKVT